MEGLKSGMTRRAAAAYAGVSQDVIYDWINKKANFATQVMEAENIAESRYTSVIVKAAFGHDVTVEKTVTRPNGDIITTVETKREYDWQAAKWWLSRRRRQDYGDTLNVNLDSEIDKVLLALQNELPPVIEEEDSHTVH